MENVIFIVSRFPGGAAVENVILAAPTREIAKRRASRILGGNPDEYVVDPITKRGSHTVLLLTED